MPAAGFLEMAFEFGANFLWNVQFTSMLPLLSEKTIAVEVTSQEARWSVRSSPPSTSDSATRLHAEGYMSKEPIVQVYESLDINAIKNDCDTEINTEAFYDSIRHFAQYGPTFRRVDKFFVSKTGNIAFTEVRGYLADLALYKRRYVLNPVILDACFHAMIHPFFTSNKDPNVYYLPSEVGSVILHSHLSEKATDIVYAYITLTHWSLDTITCDLIVANTSGERICTLLDFSAARHEKVHDNSGTGTSYDIIYQPVSIPALSVTILGTSESDGGSKSTTIEPYDSTLVSGSYEFAFSIAIHAIEQVLNAIVCTAQKQVIRILDIGIGCSTILDDPKMNEIFALYHSRGVTIHYMRCGPSSRRDPDNSSAPIVEHRKACLTNTPTLPSSTFDLILTSSTSTSKDLYTYVTSLHTLLVPGGCLLISSVGWQNDTESPNAVESSEWVNTLTRTGYLPSSVTSTGNLGGFTLVSQKCPLQLPEFTSTAVKVYEFTLNVAELQHMVKQCQESGVPLWITADLDCGSAVGFVRSLRKEMGNLDIRLVSFDATWCFAKRFDFVQRLAQVSGLEPEMQINSQGEILVPRFVPRVLKMRPDTPLIVRPTAPKLDGSVLVKITRAYSTSVGLCGIVGRVVRVLGDQNPTESEVVMGVIDQNIASDTVYIHEGSLVSLSTQRDSLSYAAFAVPLFIAALSLGPSYIRNPSRVKNKRVIVTNEDPFLASVLVVLLKHFGLDAQTLTIAPTCEVLGLLKKSDLIISFSTSSSTIQILQSVLSTNASLQLIADVDCGVGAQMKRDPWIVQGMLHELLELHQSAIEHTLFDVTLPDDSTLIRPVHATLFRPDKAYILIGGIGFLGFDIALWMYENGARELILTSRSGRTSLSKPENLRSMRMARYLERLPGLMLRMVSCDGTSETEMAKLFASITAPLGGCFLLSALLNDRLFLSHTDVTFDASVAPKKRVFEVVETLMPVDSLDFLIAVSSMATFGSAGQTSYASGNTALDWMLRKYTKAFSLVAPAITDRIAGDERYKAWESFSMSSKTLCACIADGLMKLKADSNFWLYIPDVKWVELLPVFTSSRLYEHLISRDEDAHVSEPSVEADISELRKIVLNFLDVKSEDFSDETPLSSYGLDSLIAGKLVFALKPFVQISQLELLADLTLNDISGRMHKETSSASLINHADVRLSWESLNQRGQTVVKLVEGEGIPFIIVHGSGGNILPFLPLQKRFSLPLWGIQATTDAPLGSVSSIARFYFNRIKEHLPKGPYRLGSFSSSAFITHELVFLFESNGDDVVQFVNLDFPPTVFIPPTFTWDAETIETTRPSQKLMQEVLNFISALTNADIMMSQELLDVPNGSPSDDSMHASYQFLEEGIVAPIARLLSDLAKQTGKELGSVANDSNNLQDLIIGWTKRVRAPLQIVLPENGLTSIIQDRDLESLRIRELQRDVSILHLKDAGHFSMFENDELVDFLQNGWRA